MNDRQTALTLAALRCLQQAYDSCAGDLPDDLQDIIDAGTDPDADTNLPEEVDQLCMRINELGLTMTPPSAGPHPDQFLLDDFAKHAMATLLHPDVTAEYMTEVWGSEVISVCAYKMAEGMLDERAKASRKYTVMLRAPDWLDLDDDNLFFRVEADSPQEAYALACEQAAAQNTEEGGEPKEDPTLSFSLIALFRGWEAELSAYVI